MIFKSDKFFLKLLVILFCSIISFNLYAEIKFQFNSNFNFKSDVTVLPGTLEGHVLPEDPNVKLLIGYFSDKKFKSEASATSDESLKKNFLEKAALMDSINSQSDREIVGFKRSVKDGAVVVLIKYKLMKNGQKWNEANTYIFEANSSALASVQFPDYLSDEKKLELLKGIDSIQIGEPSANAVVKNIKENLFKLVSLKSLKRIGAFVVDNSYAEMQTGNAPNCNLKNIAKSNVYSTKPGSALYNFSKIFNSIEEEARSLNNNSDDSNLKCLMNLYKNTKDSAAASWAREASEHNCLNSDDSILSYKEIKNISNNKDRNACMEVKNSMHYLDNLETNFKMFLKGEGPKALECSKNHVRGEPRIDELEVVMDQAEKTFCCEARNPQAKDDTGGPLFQMVEADYIKEHNIKGQLSSSEMASLSRECREKKYSAKDKAGQSMLSANGFADCAENFMEGAKDLITSAISTVKSLFDLETIKALGQLVTELPGSAINMVKVMGQEIAAKAASVTMCMSPYDAKQYVCKMVPEVAAILLGPGLIKKFAQSLVATASKTALAEVVSQAVGQSTKLKKLSAASSAVKSGAVKVAKAAAGTRIGKPSAAALSKVSKILGKDISTPAKDLIAGKVKKLKNGSLDPASKELYRSAAKNTGKEITASKEEILRASGRLSDSQRVEAAATVVERRLSASEEAAVLKAHNVGSEAGHGFGTYTPSELREKVEILKAAGFTPNEFDKLMRTGVTGNPPRMAGPGTENIGQAKARLAEANWAGEKSVKLELNADGSIEPPSSWKQTSEAKLVPESKPLDDGLDFTQPKENPLTERVRQLKNEGKTSEEIKQIILNERHQGAASPAPAKPAVKNSSVTVADQVEEYQKITLSDGVEVSIGQKMGRGNAGTVYQIDKDRVIKLPNDAGNVRDIALEVQNYNKISEAGITGVPIYNLPKDNSVPTYLIKKKLTNMENLDAQTVKSFNTGAYAGKYTPEQEQSLRSLYKKIETYNRGKTADAQLNLDLNPANLYWDQSKKEFLIIEGAPPTSGNTVSKYWVGPNGREHFEDRYGISLSGQ